MMDEVASDRLKMIADPANVSPAARRNVRRILSTCSGVWAGHSAGARQGHPRIGRYRLLRHRRWIVDFAYLAELLYEYGFTGDMMLHGIYDEQRFEFTRSGAAVAKAK